MPWARSLLHQIVPELHIKHQEIFQVFSVVDHALLIQCELLRENTEWVNLVVDPCMWIDQVTDATDRIIDLLELTENDRHNLFYRSVFPFDLLL